VKAFQMMLKDLRRGDSLAEAEAELAKVVAAVRLTGKSGELTLKLKVKTASKGDASTLMIEDTITTKVPKPERANTIFYPNEDNLLQRIDPHQQDDLPLKVVADEEEPEKLRKVK
jgi:translation elongation factor P/translation initiation factor 5A